MGGREGTLGTALGIETGGGGACSKLCDSSCRCVLCEGCFASDSSSSESEPAVGVMSCCGGGGGAGRAF